MIEIVFNGGNSGNLYYNYGSNAKNIISLDLHLDYGPLEERIDSKFRMEYADYLNMDWYIRQQGMKMIAHPGKENKKEFKALKKQLAAGDDVRIWYDETPETMCGFYAICDYLMDCKNKVYVIKSPRCIKDGQGWCIASGWGTFNGVPVEPLLPLTRELERGEQQVYAEYWHRLVRENAPLRTVIAGMPISVAEDFYDHFLEEFIPEEEPIKLGKLIFQVPGKYPLGMNTVWYEKTDIGFHRPGQTESRQYRLLQP